MPRLDDAVRAGRRQALLDAASRCLARMAYRDLRVADVCAEAGFSKGAFYGYFESKADLFFALLADQRTLIDEAADGVDGTVASLRAFLSAMLGLGEDPASVQLRGDFWAAVQSDPALRERFARVVGERRGRMREAIEAGVARGDLPAGLRANAMAAIVLALGDGLLLHRALDPAAFQWENVRAVLDLLFAGLSGDAGGPEPPR